MKKYIFLLIATFSMSMFVGCDYDDDLEPLNYATFEKGPLGVGVDIDETLTYDISVFTGNVVGSDRTIDVTVGTASTLDGEAYNVPATVTIPANSNEGILSVDISDLNISASGETLVLNLVPTEELSVGAPVVLNIRTLCAEGTTEVTVNFAFDDWASETSWEITDSEGTVLFEGGGYEDGDSGVLLWVCLSPGDYTFTVYDAYGDGIPGGSGSLIANGAELGSVGGGFGDSGSFDFTIE